MLKFAILSAFACLCLGAQPAALEGTAVSAGTGTPLAGVHVSLVSVDDAYGAISDASPATSPSTTSVQAPII